MLLSFMLLCAVVASLAVGVLLAYALSVAVFGLFRIHARQVAVRKQGRVAPATLAG